MSQATPPLLSYERTGRPVRGWYWPAHLGNFLGVLITVGFLAFTVFLVIPRFDALVRDMKWELPEPAGNTLRCGRWCAGGLGLLVAFLLLSAVACVGLAIDGKARRPEAIVTFSRWFRRALLLLCLLWVAAMTISLCLFLMASPCLITTECIDRPVPRPPKGRPRTATAFAGVGKGGGTGYGEGYEL